MAARHRRRLTFLPILISSISCGAILASTVRSSAIGTINITARHSLSVTDDDASDDNGRKREHD